MTKFKGSILVWIAVAVVIIMFGKRLFSKGGLFSFGSDGTTDTADVQKKLVDGTLVDPKKMSKSNQEIQQRAEKLDKAMRDWGTDVSAILQSLSGLNAEDLRAIYKAFGFRQETLFGIPTFQGNLFAWFEAELSGTDLAQVKQIFTSKTDLWS